MMSNPGAVSRFDEIYDSTSRAVLAFITAKCRNTADISDIFQDTYLELYQILFRRGTDYVTNGKALVMRIAKRKIAKYYSFSERFKMFVSITAVNEDDEEIDLSDSLADDFLTEDFAVNQIMLEKIREYIRQKPEDVKKVFYLYYDVGLTIPEISRELPMSESNVKNKLYRTVKELRKILS